MDLNPTCTVTVGGASREIFMSHGLLSTVLRTLGSPDNIGVMFLDPDLRDAVLKDLLAERSKGGKLLNEVDLYDLDVSLDDLNTLLNWAGGHVLDFFVKSAQRAGQLSQAMRPEVEKAMSSLDGSKG